MCLSITTIIILPCLVFLALLLAVHGLFSLRSATRATLNGGGDTAIA
jgi:hypothetical protein